MRALQIFAGLVLLCIGLLLFGYTSGFLLATTNDLFGIALILSGVLFWIPGLVWRKPLPWLTALFIPGTLAFAIGAIMLYIGQAGSAAWVYLMPIPIIVIGFAFLSMYVLGPRVHWLRFVGAIITLIALALFALVLTVSTEFAARIIGPVVLIGLGLLIAVRPLVTRSK